VRNKSTKLFLPVLLIRTPNEPPVKLLSQNSWRWSPLGFSFLIAKSVSFAIGIQEVLSWVTATS